MLLIIRRSTVRPPMRLLLLVVVAEMSVGCSHLTYRSTRTEVDESARRLVAKEDGGVELTLRRRGAAPPELVLVRIRNCVYAIDKTTKATEEVLLSGTGRAVIAGPIAAAVGIGAVAGTVYLLDRTGGEWSGGGEVLFWLGLGAGAAVFLAFPTYQVVSRADPIITHSSGRHTQERCSEERPTGTLTGVPPFEPMRVENGRFDVSRLWGLEGPASLSFEGWPVRMAPMTDAEEVERVIACAAVSRLGAQALPEQRERCQTSKSTAFPRGSRLSLSP